MVSVDSLGILSVQNYLTVVDKDQWTYLITQMSNQKKNKFTKSSPEISFPNADLMHHS